ncbi:hypothetical protein PROFUN_08917 [Planoprotostelium fungivorum]|uniref:Uncharacterized protein n=1 Tax=Planoprotostelium fungivorum TaxID=1890364 RepID=A0A2P6NIV5_9EUKA|nr:hypothetical protein PROFUN_08917 [Planoprotostelium fungivorum]
MVFFKPIASHPILEAPEIQDIILRYVFDYDEQSVHPFTQHRHSFCPYDEMDRNYCNKEEMNRRMTKAMEGYRRQQCQSVERLQTWKAIRQCSRRMRQVADQFCTFETWHYLLAIFRSDLPAVRFFLSKPEIDVWVDYRDNMDPWGVCGSEKIRRMLEDRKLKRELLYCDSCGMEH